MRQFRIVPDLIRNGLAAKRHSVDEIIVATGGRLDISQARALRDWLTSALPCEHRGSRSGTWSGTDPLVMRCDICGEEVSGYEAVPHGWVV
jgi:hypothetical protein